MKRRADVSAYQKPISLAETRAAYSANPHARLLAGGTDLLLALRAESPPASLGGGAELISLKDLEELSRLRQNDDGTLFLGAMTRLAAIEKAPQALNAYPALVQAAASIGTPSIRVTATVGGNICNASPSADMAPALLIYDAAVVIDRAGETHIVALESFFEGPGKTVLAHGDIVLGFLLPHPVSGTRSAFMRHARVRSVDIATVNAAMAIRLEAGVCSKARVAFGAVAPRPLRLAQAEKALEGWTPGADTSRLEEAVTASITPIDDVRAGATYRLEVARVLTRRLLRHITDDPPGRGGE